MRIVIRLAPLLVVACLLAGCQKKTTCESTSMECIDYPYADSPDEVPEDFGEPVDIDDAHIVEHPTRDIYNVHYYHFV